MPHLPDGSQWCLPSQSQTRRLDLAFQQQLERRLLLWGSCKCFLHQGDDQIKLSASAFSGEDAKVVSECKEAGDNLRECVSSGGFRGCNKEHRR
jgi:hypothetical protein